ncbi:MAG: 16S rRNA (guanine(527)-N(7))-methyltransferase RsmG [Chloroflexota bacterium]|nr:16S rRNA (guanine(527)-N(7))-methyltransferase RsmG [Chloroflexota bacterium]
MKLQDGARHLGIDLSSTQLEAFDLYRAELLAWNQRFNLTGITDPDEVDTKHFLDSLSVLVGLTRIDGRSVADRLGSVARAVDVGAGAGFPGLPLKLVWPGLKLTLVESTGKKCRFLTHIVQQMKLQDVTVVQARAEDFGQGEGRASFDLAFARAVNRLPILLEYTLPLLHRGGYLIAQKGRDPQEEASASDHALRTLGGEVQDILPVTVPGLDAQRTLITVAKVRKTPQEYPRRPGMPKQQPL